eukprot:Em0019g282a
MQHTLNLVASLNRTGIFQKRGFFQWINFVFNRVDESRVKEIGPDRAAAEWILRLGGTVKFFSLETWSTDYNRLPSGSRDELKLEAIDAAGISMTDNGLEHLAGLRKLQVLNLSGCKYLGDGGLVHLAHVKDSLKHLDLSCIPSITEKGLPSLYCLRFVAGFLCHKLSSSVPSPPTPPHAP